MNTKLRKRIMEGLCRVIKTPFLQCKPHVLVIVTNETAFPRRCLAQPFCFLLFCPFNDALVRRVRSCAELHEIIKRKCKCNCIAAFLRAHRAIKGCLVERFYVFCSVIPTSVLCECYPFDL